MGSSLEPLPGTRKTGLAPQDQGQGVEVGGGAQGGGGLVPEVSAADVSEPGAAQAARFHEVLGGEHEGPHPRLWHGLLRIQGLRDEEAAPTGQVRAPHPVGKGHAHSASWRRFPPHLPSAPSTAG